MIVVVIIGILAALAIYGVQKYVSNSKSAEARQVLGRISKDALASFEAESHAYKILSFNKTAGISRRLCGDAGNTIPTAPTSIKAKKYQPDPAEFQVGNKDTGWFCLKTVVTTPIYFMYEYSSNAVNPAAANHAFNALAYGDLDGDTTLSTFVLGGIVKQQGNDLALVLGTTVGETDPEE